MWIATSVSTTRSPIARRVGVVRELVDLIDRPQDRPVDPPHDVEGIVALLAEPDHGRHGDLGVLEGGDDPVLAAHVVSRGEPRAERRAAQRPAASGRVDDRVGEVRAPAGDLLEAQRQLDPRRAGGEPGLHAGDVDSVASLRSHGGEAYCSRGRLRRRPDDGHLAGVRRVLRGRGPRARDRTRAVSRRQRGAGAAARSGDGRARRCRVRAALRRAARGCRPRRPDHADVRRPRARAADARRRLGGARWWRQDRADLELVGARDLRPARVDRDLRRRGDLGRGRACTSRSPRSTCSPASGSGSSRRRPSSSTTCARTAPAPRRSG